MRHLFQSGTFVLAQPVVHQGWFQICRPLAIFVLFYIAKGFTLLAGIPIVSASLPVDGVM